MKESWFRVFQTHLLKRPTLYQSLFSAV